MNKLSSSDLLALTKLASSLPVGSGERKALLASLEKQAEVSSVRLYLHPGKKSRIGTDRDGSLYFSGAIAGTSAQFMVQKTQTKWAVTDMNEGYYAFRMPTAKGLEKGPGHFEAAKAKVLAEIQKNLAKADSELKSYTALFEAQSAETLIAFKNLQPPVSTP